MLIESGPASRGLCPADKNRRATKPASVDDMESDDEQSRRRKSPMKNGVHSDLGERGIDPEDIAPGDPHATGPPPRRGRPPQGAWWRAARRAVIVSNMPPALRHDAEDHRPLAQAEQHQDDGNAAPIDVEHIRVAGSRAALRPAFFPGWSCTRLAPGEMPSILGRRMAGRRYTAASPPCQPATFAPYPAR